MQPKIFYSWQTDCPQHINKQFISEAIQEAITSSPNFSIEPALRVDSGMDDVPGSPEVARIMFDKISSSAIFIADVSLVGNSTTNSQNVKKLANPNVLIEMGFAASAIGWERILCVMNESFGTRHEQPFDIRNRRFPIDYKLPPDATPAQINKEKNSLVKILKDAIPGVLAYQNELVIKAKKRLDVNSLNVMYNFGKNGLDFFSDPHQNAWVTGGAMDSNRFHNGISRLLDLGLIFTEVKKGVATYSYFWTYLGVEVLKELGIRS
jgi:hypothetical protein